MTAKRRLIPEAELRALLDLFKEYGLPIGAVDVRADGVTITPPAPITASTDNPESAYAQWKAQDKNRVRTAHR